MKKNLITVLKKLLAAFGGEETDSNNAVDIVDKIADSVEQGGSGSGGGETMLFTPGESSDPTCDKTFSEITNLIKNKTPLVAFYKSGALGDIVGQTNTICPYYAQGQVRGYDAFFFEAPMGSTDPISLTVNIWRINYDNSITEIRKTIALT